MSGHRPRLGTCGRLVLTAAISVLVVRALPAHADPARARAHFELGRRYFQVDEYRKAMEEFKAAHIEEPDPAFLYNIAECHRRLGENKEAVVLYRRFLGLIPPNAPARANVEKRIAELQSAPDTGAPAPAAPAAGIPERVPAPAAEPDTRVALAPRAADPAPAAVAVSGPPLTIGTSAQESTPAAADASRPFYKSGWFYAVLGGVLIAGAAGAWAISSGRDTPVPTTDLGNKSVFHP